MNHWQPEFGGTGPRGRLDFSGNLSGLRGGQTPNFYNQYASFLLGLTSQVQKAIQWEEMKTREWRYGFYFGDRWQVHRDVTLDLGVRYEYFPLVTRGGDRGVERLDVDTMEVLLGGVGDIPRNVGLKTRKTDFAPRVGIAWRLNEATVARAGYGLTYNPLPFARPLRGAYPLTIHNTYVSLNSWQPYGTLEQGIPEFTGPGPDEGRVPLPRTATMRTPDPDNVHRGYIQSWNVTFERRLPLDMSVNAGLRRHGHHTRLRQHRAERVPSGRRRAGAGLRPGVRADSRDDALWRLEQEPVSLAAAAAQSAVQERLAAARGVHARKGAEHDRYRRHRDL